MKELEITVDLSLVFQALLSFEGLFIWKISPYVFAKYRIDYIGNPKIKESPNEILDRWWKKEYNEHLSGCFLLLTLLVYLFIFCRALFNWIAGKLRYTPYLTVIMYAFCVLIQSLFHPKIFNYIFSNQRIEGSIFFFMCIKLICIIISFCCNYLYFHLESFKLPEEETIKYIRKVL